MLSIEYHSSATSVFLLFTPQVLALPGYIAFMGKKKFFGQPETRTTSISISLAEKH